MLAAGASDASSADTYRAKRFAEAENAICCKLHKTHMMIPNHSDPSGDYLLTSLQIESSCLVGLTLTALWMNYSCRATMASKLFGKHMQSQYQAQNIKGKVGLQTTNAPHYPDQLNHQ